MTGVVKQKSLCKIVTLTKNEYDLIEDFLIYHSSIVGIENIVIVDNGSDDERVLKTYETYKAKGLTVETDSERGMMSMAQIVTDAMTRHKDECTFLMPLDTDEFIFFPRLDSTESKKATFEAILKGVDEDVSVLRYSAFWGSIADSTSGDYVDYKHSRPARSITKFHDQGWDKLIVRASEFVSITQGNHHAVVTGGSALKVDLGLLHFHETGAARKKERCIMSMKGYSQMDLDGYHSVLKGDLWLQLRYVDYIIAQQVFGGHRVEQYRTFLRREIICQEMEGLLARRPSSLEEALQFLDDENLWVGETLETPAVVRAAIVSKCRAVALGEVKKEDVIYHEASREGIKVTQVAEFFAQFKE